MKCKAPEAVAYFRPQIYSEKEIEKLEKLTEEFLNLLIPEILKNEANRSCRADVLPLVARVLQQHREKAEDRYIDILYRDSSVNREIQKRFQSGEISYEQAIAMLKNRQTYSAKWTSLMIDFKQERKVENRSGQPPRWKVINEALKKAETLTVGKLSEFLAEFSAKHPDLIESAQFRLLLAEGLPYEELVLEAEKYDFVDYQFTQQVMEKHDTETMDLLLSRFYEKEEDWNFLLTLAIHSNSLESFEHLLENGVGINDAKTLEPDALDRLLSQFETNSESASLIEAIFANGVELEYSHKQLMAATYQINPGQVEAWISNYDLDITIEELVNDF